MDISTGTASYEFGRYLASKKRLDDRSLNQVVWQQMVEAFRETKPPRNILELGCGIGTMLERFLERNVLAQVSYTGIDRQPELLATARERVEEWRPVMQVWEVETSWQEIDLDSYLAQSSSRQWDLMMAHAFLDLIDVPTTLPVLFSRLKPGGLFYFTLNFDGHTILEPVIDQELDEQIVRMYHQTMDDRTLDGKPAGHSQTGRRLFHQILDLDGKIIAAGSSDWVVVPTASGYMGDEAYFLHYIIHTIHGALRGHAALDARRFESWIAQRHQQIEEQRLVYIAHQLDILGTTPVPARQE